MHVKWRLQSQLRYQAFRKQTFLLTCMKSTFDGLGSGEDYLSLAGTVFNELSDINEQHLDIDPALIVWDEDSSLIGRDRVQFCEQMAKKVADVQSRLETISELLEKFNSNFSLYHNGGCSCGCVDDAAQDGMREATKASI